MNHLHEPDHTDHGPGRHDIQQQDDVIHGVTVPLTPGYCLRLKA
jgi:hypothetical protein